MKVCLNAITPMQLNNSTADVFLFFCKYKLINTQQPTFFSLTIL